MSAEGAKADSTPSTQLPKYWELLSQADRDQYKYLQMTLSSSACKNRRNHSLETFIEVLETIKQYVIHGDDDDWKRAIVCGICWLDNSIAINTRQLRLLICKCKSSINGSLQAMGYGTVPTGADSSCSLINYFPVLKNNFPELRQWTVRLKMDQSLPHMKLSDIMQNAINQAQGNASDKPEEIPTAIPTEIARPIQTIQSGSTN